MLGFPHNSTKLNKGHILKSTYKRLEFKKYIRHTIYCKPILVHGYWIQPQRFVIFKVSLFNDEPR